ncbi:hypothetical protein [Halomonas litopenaei]|uniref:hypothetical protein n=1 Tax=Halomonas litopenaei TaxID=2109328 RepID=UPI001A8C2312|nr:hypothetical protein [Halomonas litopenaei]MBN8411309.1 hypothetical protein [Halomonas litopenaei]
MTMRDISAESLALWREREMITGAEAAYLLARKAPVQNPSPSMPGPIGEMYRHVLYAVKAGRLSTVDGVYKRIDIDPEWLGSLTLEEYSAWSQPWERLTEAGSIDPASDVKRYRFSLKSTEFFEWAEDAGWRHAPSLNLPTDSSEASAGWWYVIPLRWAFASGRLERVGASRAILRTVAKGMEGRGFPGRPPDPNAWKQRGAVDAARANIEVDLDKRVPTRARQTALGLFAFAASLNGEVDVFDDESVEAALLQARVASPSRNLLASLYE